MHVASLILTMLLSVLPPQDPTRRVHDLANLLNNQQLQAVETICRDVEAKTTAQIAVVTVPSLDGRTVDDYGHELFNTWGIGQKDVNNGVLLLVAPNERRLRIEVGYGLEPLLTDSLCGQIRDNQIVPLFKRDDYPRGIQEGTRAIAAVLLADPAAARGDPNSGPMLARSTRKNALVATGSVGVMALVMLILGILVASRRVYSSVAFLTVTAVGLAIIGVAAYLTWRTPGHVQPTAWFSGAALASVGTWMFNLTRYRRYGPHGCSKCSALLQLLGEEEDDPKLSEVQRLEEELGSVDYDVWYCPACLHNDTERYLRPFSGFKDCPACQGRTYKEDPQVTLQAATTSSTGTARVEGRCVSCNHKTSRIVVIPKISSSSSSGGGSFGGGGGGGGGFGGGSSGGGGASGGW